MPHLGRAQEEKAAHSISATASRNCLDASWSEFGIVVTEKEVFHVSVRTNSTNASLEFFKVFLYGL
jgi:hypothetical protein